MSEFLDQDAIDAIKNKLDSLNNLKDLAESAKEKIAIMYYDLCREPMRSNLETLDEIGDVIDAIERRLKYDSKYTESFFMLRNSYIKRL